MKKTTVQKIFLLSIAIFTLTILFFFFKNVLIEIIKFKMANDTEGVNALLQDRGIMGYLTVIVIEALQMVVVFISAEFIQSAAAMSYAWYITIPLCVTGVSLGATIIYFLVNILKFDNSMFGKTNKKIDKLQSKQKNNNVTQLMLLLFITPIVPLGAIAYFGASNRISYRRYIATCALGAIPSSINSIILGSVLSYFIVNGKSLVLLVVVLIVLISILLTLTTSLINKLYFKEKSGTPNSNYYSILMFIFHLLVRSKVTTSYDKKNIEEVKGPFLLLSNHASFFDVYFLSRLAKHERMSFILNRYYFNNKFFKYIFTKMGVIPKKLFSPDMETIKKSLKTVRAGFPILMCPEGRLSIDGTNYYSTKETGKFIKSFKMPVVLARINGAYITNPKWRKNRIKGHVHTEVVRILTADEVIKMSVDEINNIINECITYNDFTYAKENNIVYKAKNKAQGLENVLYHCPHCHNEYTIKTENNKVYCSHCGFNVEIDEHYSFTNNELNINNIHDWYQKMIENEKESINNKKVNLSCEVTVKRFNFTNKKLNSTGTGICTLTNEGFSFSGKVNDTDITFKHDIKNLRGLAFSAGEEFECYYNDELYYFYPVTNRQQCTKWALIVDEMIKDCDLNE